MKTDTTTWHCDLCGEDKTLLNTIYIPQGWGIIKAAIDGWDKEKHLCSACISKCVAWLEQENQEINL